MQFAMISGWHVHAKQYAKELAAQPDCAIKTVWDEDEARGKAWAQELGCCYTPDYETILADPEICGVVISTATNAHYDMILKAVRAKKNVFTEKVLTFTGQEAKEIEQAVRETGVAFTISYPHKTRADILTAKQLADNGVLGEITYMRVRNVHGGAIDGWLPPHFYDPAQCGGGAQMDLGAHGFYLLNWFLGRPETVTSAFTKVTDHAVEDNAVSVFTYANGTIGVAETGFVSTQNPFTMEIGGTKGTLLVRDGLFYATKETGQWREVTDLLPARPILIAQWVDSIKTGSKTDGTIDEAVILSEMMELAYRAAASGTVQTFSKDC